MGTSRTESGSTASPKSDSPCKSEIERVQARWLALLAAASDYFTGYCVDEADADGCNFTGCSRAQHEAAVALRDALDDVSEDELRFALGLIPTRDATGAASLQTAPAPADGPTGSYPGRLREEEDTLRALEQKGETK